MSEIFESIANVNEMPPTGVQPVTGTIVCVPGPRHYRRGEEATAWQEYGGTTDERRNARGE